MSYDQQQTMQRVAAALRARANDARQPLEPTEDPQQLLDDIARFLDEQAAVLVEALRPAGGSFPDLFERTRPAAERRPVAQGTDRLHKERER